VATSLIILAVLLGVVLSVFALGLAASEGDATHLFRHPAKLGRAMLAMNVVMPLFTVAMVALFRLRPPIPLALVAISVAPIPPLLPRRALSAGGASSYTIGLLVAATFLAIVFVPAAVELLGLVFGKQVHVLPGKVASTVALTVLAPLSAGMLVRRVAARFAERVAKPLSVAGLVLIGVCVVPVLVATGPAMASLVGNGTLAAIVAFSVVGLASGHLLGGPDPGERKVLALTTATRHPGVAFVIASANHPEPRRVVAAILLYAIVAALVSLPYLAWSKRRAAKPALAMQT
jgi:BASS family bile acid:Na+ symporter